MERIYTDFGVCDKSVGKDKARKKNYEIFQSINAASPLYLTQEVCKNQLCKLSPRLRSIEKYSTVTSRLQHVDLVLSAVDTTNKLQSIFQNMIISKYSRHHCRMELLLLPPGLACEIS